MRHDPVDCSRMPLIFETTFLTLAFANVCGYAFAASRVRALVGNAKVVGLFNKAGGTLLIGAGLATATVRATQG